MKVLGRSRWARVWHDDDLPIEVAAALTAPLYARMGSLMIGHVAGIALCVIAICRIGGPWPLAFLAGSLVMLGARIAVLRQVNRAHAYEATEDRPDGPLRFRRRYQAVGLGWAVVSAALCGHCVLVSGDEATRLLGIILTLGTCSGIASRNAGTPRFAIAQLSIWMTPQMVAAGLLGGVYWAAALMHATYLAALCSIVRQHYSEIRSLILADRQSRAMQATLAAREAELRAIFENAAAGLVELDVPARRLLRVNPYFCRLTGRSSEELLGDLDMAAATHPGDRAADAARWGTRVVIGHTFTYEKRFVRPDGSVVWVRFSAWVTAVGSDGRPTRVVGIGQDCTEQKAAEAALRSSEEMLRLSLDVGRIGSYRRDFREGVIYCGMETRLMHGLPLDGQPVPWSVWADMLLPEDRAQVIKNIAAGQAARQETNALEYRFLHPTDGLRHIETRSRTQFSPDGEPLLAFGVAIDVTERREAEARIAHLAHHDPLTALPNRSLFRIRLDDALARARRGELFALCCLDLDRFKEVNDTLGHPVGDALLQGVTERLKLAVRPTDTVARLGGDEFAVIQTSLDRPADAIALAERLIAALEAPFELDGYHVAIGTSIGITIAPEDGLGADMLLRHADMALYVAKTEGRGRYRLFERRMDADLQARRTLEMDLRQAMELSEFRLFYQPVVDIATRTVRGFEALLRWQHPTRGLVPPDRFIPMAESIGLLVPVGAWVLRHACGEAAGWSEARRVAVNLSATQFASRTLVDDVAGALRESGLDPHLLELEITETAMLHETEATLATLHELKALGVTIAMDDFGTGYSSLGYLQRFAFDKVKIDRSFISHLGSTRASTAIVSAVIDLCRGLDMLTTAEGVETEVQFDALARIGCAEAQGYLFSPPRPAGEIAAMIARIQGLVVLAPAAAD